MPDDFRPTASRADCRDTAQLLAQAGAAAEALRALVTEAAASLRGRVAPSGRIDPALLAEHQHASHALAWLATYAEAIAQMSDWAQGLAVENRLGETETLLLQIGTAEYLAQVQGGIAMSQGEFARLGDLGLSWTPPADLAELVATGNSPQARARLVALMRAAGPVAVYGDPGQSEEMGMIRDTFRRFTEAEILPHAQTWHLQDALIPAEILTKLAEMGVFGLTIPEEFGGLALPKEAMAVVSEELSRGYLGAGSLGTRAEIAAELILGGGTEAQKQHWLPRIASGETLPTAVFTEPDTGSDLGALRTRATRRGEGWEVTGNKTWITHAARAGLMTLLARTDPESRDHRGLSMFLAEKPPATEQDDFPAAGMEGSEIRVIGYRGMKEYELSFDGFQVAGDGLLGGAEGQGFRQLMKTFEGARIQTAARAIGVAQNALDLALRYAEERRQFGQELAAFQRISGKIAMMAVEVMIARQLTYHSAARKDSGQRCDLEAGMAKLLAARVAWAAADNALQVHGGNGFAEEYAISRVLCDARILNIFEGAGEIQAQVIARRVLEAG